MTVTGGWLLWLCSSLGVFSLQFFRLLPLCHGGPEHWPRAGWGLGQPSPTLELRVKLRVSVWDPRGTLPFPGELWGTHLQTWQCAPYPPPGIISRPEGTWWCTCTGQCSFRLSECAGCMVSHLNCWYDYYIYIVLLHSWRVIQTWLHKNDPNQYLKNYFKLSCPSSGGVCPLEFS